jgi:hypothetical protein
MVRVAAISAVVISALTMAAGSAAAQESKFAPIPRGPIPEQPPCTCRAGGQSFEMGATICLRTPEGSRMARCVMVINNPSWEPTDKSCPSAGIAPFSPRLRG